MGENNSKGCQKKKGGGEKALFGEKATRRKRGYSPMERGSLDTDSGPEAAFPCWKGKKLSFTILTFFGGVRAAKKKLYDREGGNRSPNFRWKKKESPLKKGVASVRFE